MIQTLTWINMPQRTLIVYSRSFLQVVVYDKPPMDVCPDLLLVKCKIKVRRILIYRYGSMIPLENGDHWSYMVIPSISG